MYSGVTTDDAMNLAMSAKAVPLYNAVKEFIANVGQIAGSTAKASLSCWTS
jgi:hypothetical protein